MVPTRGVRFFAVSMQHVALLFFFRKGQHVKGVNCEIGRMMIADTLTI